jgi:hypothetical protein
MAVIKNVLSIPNSPQNNRAEAGLYYPVIDPVLYTEVIDVVLFVYIFTVWRYL